MLGDGRGGIVHFGERECTLQRRHQKLVEMAPSPSLIARRCAKRCCAAALRLAAASVATADWAPSSFWSSRHRAGQGCALVFIEANPRLQVEHTVTEMVTGLDLVRLQLQVAGRSHAGRPRSDAGTRQPAHGACPRNCASMPRRWPQTAALTPAAGG